MSNLACSLCGSPAVELLYTEAPDYFTSDHFQILQCQSCGIAFTWPQPADLSAYYPTKYRDYHPLIKSLISLIYGLRVKQWAKRFPKPGKAFEMGCGNGIMLKALQDLGWNVLGSERTDESAAYARTALGLPVITTGFESLGQAPQFDLIILFQVLEHMNRPKETIQQLSKLLNQNGMMVVGVPDFKSWQSSFGKENWFHLDPPRHLHHFSVRAIESCIKGTGLKIVNTSNISFEHDPYGWVQTVLNRVDHQYNRLTKLLLRQDKPDPINLLHLALAFPLGLVSVPWAMFTWLVKKGALIEVILQKSSPG